MTRGAAAPVFKGPDLRGRRPHATTSWPWFIAYLAFVTYGSLVPLDYRPIPWDAAVRQFAQTPFLNIDAGGRADWIANAVLYVPLALLATRALLPLFFSSLWLAGLAAFIACGTVAVGVEFTQLYFPPRTVSQNDILAELIGSALGVAAAARLGGWMRRMRDAWALRGERVLVLSLEAYALVYLGLSFFPYDLMLSAAELRGKLDSGLWGWWLAASDRGLALALLQLVVETVLCVPLGMLMLLAGRRGWQGFARPVMWGLLLGAVIELGQFLIVSGVSQGASVLTRGLGLSLGAWLAPRLRTLSPNALRAALRPAALPVLSLWLPLLLFISGWLRRPMQGADAALAVWRELHWLPFYYHYYTTEAVALFSLGSVALMYLPGALLGWARRWPATRVAAATVVLASLVEASKLLLKGMHPDPTNPLIAVSSCVLLLWVMQRWSAPATVAAALRESPPDALPDAPPSRWPARVGSAALLLVALVMAAQFPVAAVALCLGLTAVAMLVAWRPVLALAIVAAAMPALDLAPWSGRLYVDEFDLLLLVCIGVAWARTSAATPTPWDAGRAAFAVVGASLVVATLRALSPWPGLDAGSFSNLVTPFVALRIAKGAVWAWLFVLLWRRLQAQGEQRSRMFSAGMALGLLVTVLWLLWERAAYGVLGDFASDLRATGPFSAMSKGGAYIECYLVVACAFVLAELLRPQLTGARRAAWLALLAAGVFGVMLTFSRNGYGGLAVVLLAMAAALWRGANAPRRTWGLAALAVMLVVALPMALTPFARARLATSVQDLAVRQAHWADAMQLRSTDTMSQLLGEGLGRFPDMHFWGSREAVHAGSYRLVHEGSQRFLRLGGGATVYVEQVLPTPRLSSWVLQARLRAAKGPPILAVTLCEKSTLTSRACTEATLTARADTAPASWQTVRVNIALPPASSPQLAQLPLKLSLLTPAAGASVDVTDLRLTAMDGQQLLANGSFIDGMDRWFFSTDVDPPWHIHSLPLAWLFDQGWLGLLSWLALVAWAVTAGLQRVGREAPPVWGPMAALLAYLSCGTLNTLVDEPRFVWLLLVLLWLTGRGAYAAGPQTATRERRDRASRQN